MSGATSPAAWRRPSSTRSRAPRVRHLAIRVPDVLSVSGTATIERAIHWGRTPPECNLAEAPARSMGAVIPRRPSPSLGGGGPCGPSTEHAAMTDG